MLSVRLDSNVPLVEQLVTGVRLAIARGELTRGDPLPTVRQLAADLGINLNTVARAYRSLESNGLVSTARGRGTVVAGERDSGVTAGAARKTLIERLRLAFADARLAGVDRGRVEKLVQAELDGLWTKE